MPKKKDAPVTAGEIPKFKRLVRDNAAEAAAIRDWLLKVAKHFEKRCSYGSDDVLVSKGKVWAFAKDLREAGFGASQCYGGLTPNKGD
jgi:hypothetical protein